MYCYMNDSMVIGHQMLGTVIILEMSLQIRTNIIIFIKITDLGASITTLGLTPHPFLSVTEKIDGLIDY